MPPLLLAASNPAPFALCLAVVAVVAGGALGLIQWRRRWTVLDTPTSECAGVFVGRNEVIGRAQPWTPMASPLSGRPAVWFEWKIEHWVENSKGGEWHHVDGATTAAPFWVTDASGSVLVRPRDAEVKARQTVQDRLRSLGLALSMNDLHLATLQGEDEQERQASMAHPRFQGALNAISTLLDSSPDATSPLRTWGDDYRVTEHLIEPGADLYVLGTTELRADSTGLEFAQRSDDAPLLIANGTEQQVARGAGWLAALGLIVALFGVLGLPGALLAMRTTFAGGPVPGSRPTLVAVRLWMALAALAYLAALLGVFLSRHYNRLVAVKEQAAAAWSLIDVALRRRHDLIPQLVDATRAYASHERVAQQTMAEIRSRTDELPSEALPSDATITAANTIDQQDRTSSRTLVGLGEAYPDLHANDQFRRLADEITATENQVAAARRFYNDAVNVLRDRRQTFPGRFFAPLVKVPSWELFAGADGDTGSLPSQAPDAPRPLGGTGGSPPVAVSASGEGH